MVAIEVLIGGARMDAPPNPVAGKGVDTESVSLSEDYLVVSGIDDLTREGVLSSSTARRTRINGRECLIWESCTPIPVHGSDYVYSFIVVFFDAGVAIGIVFIGDRMLQHARDCPPSERRSSGTCSAAQDRRYSWAELLRPVFAVDVLRCGNSGRRRQVIALITRADPIQRILTHFGLATKPPPITPARTLPQPAVPF